MPSLNPMIYFFNLFLGKTGKTLPSICGTNTDYHSKHPNILTQIHSYQQCLFSVCWIWRDVDGHGDGDEHVGVDHLDSQVEYLDAANTVHGFLQVIMMVISVVQCEGKIIPLVILKLCYQITHSYRTAFAFTVLFKWLDSRC